MANNNYREEDHPRAARSKQWVSKDKLEPVGILPDDFDEEQVKAEEFDDLAFTDYSFELLDDSDPRMQACRETASILRESKKTWPGSRLGMGDRGIVYVENEQDDDLRSELKIGENADGMILTATQQRRNKNGDWENTEWGASTSEGRFKETRQQVIDTAFQQVFFPEYHPTIAPTALSTGYMGSIARTGGKFDASRRPAETAKLMRADLKQFQKAGILPRDYKFSVRKKEWSMGWGATITITLPEGEHRYHVPTQAEYHAMPLAERTGRDRGAADRLLEKYGSDGWDAAAERLNRKIDNNERLTPDEYDYCIESQKVRQAKKTCKKIAEQYTHDGSNSMVDYFDIDGYVDVDVVEGKGRR